MIIFEKEFNGERLDVIGRVFIRSYFGSCKIMVDANTSFYDCTFCCCTFHFETFDLCDLTVNGPNCLLDDDPYNLLFDRVYEFNPFLKVRNLSNKFLVIKNKNMRERALCFLVSIFKKCNHEWIYKGITGCFFMSRNLECSKCNKRIESLTYEPPLHDGYEVWQRITKAECEYFKSEVM